MNAVPPISAPPSPSAASPAPVARNNATAPDQTALVSPPVVAPKPASAPKSVSAGAAYSAAEVPAVLTHRVDPVYPLQAQSAHVGGVVKLHIVIGKDGNVEDVSVVSGPAMLIRAAREAVLQWEYKPAHLHGRPVRTETDAAIIFRP